MKKNKNFIVSISFTLLCSVQVCFFIKAQAPGTNQAQQTVTEPAAEEATIITTPVQPAFIRPTQPTQPTQPTPSAMAGTALPASVGTAAGTAPSASVSAPSEATPGGSIGTAAGTTVPTISAKVTQMIPAAGAAIVTPPTTVTPTAATPASQPTIAPVVTPTVTPAKPTVTPIAAGTAIPAVPTPVVTPAVTPAPTPTVTPATPTVTPTPAVSAAAAQPATTAPAVTPVPTPITPTATITPAAPIAAPATPTPTITPTPTLATPTVTPIAASTAAPTVPVPTPVTPAIPTPGAAPAVAVPPTVTPPAVPTPAIPAAGRRGRLPGRRRRAPAVPTVAPKARRRAVPVPPAVPTVPLEGPPNTPVTITPAQAAEGITEIPAPVRKRRPFSMADIPETAEERKLEEKTLELPGISKTEEEKKEEEIAAKRLKASGEIYLGQYTAPWEGIETRELIEMNFENKELSALLKFLEDNLNITFILDDYIEPQRTDGMQPLAGTKISFKSNIPLTLRQVWELSTTFLEMAGFSIIPTTVPRTYRVTLSASKDKPSANREPLPTFIGTEPDILPDSDLKIRYVYFAENAELATISQIIEALKSASAGPLIEFPQLRAVMITDKSASIKSLVQVLQEIDSVTLPETLAVIRLRHADARQVRELYYRLIGKDPNAPTFSPFGRQRKPATTQYFSESTRIFEEPRTNSLIVLGTKDNIKRFEDFIIKYIDRTLELPFSPLHIIQLKYIDAASIAKILNDVIQKFNADPANAAAAAVGGVRDANKFFRPTVRITEETSGNRLIINADYDEYLKLRKIIEQLDVEQPQVAIKVLVLNVDLTDTRMLGTQLRNSVGCCDGTGGTTSILGPNVNFQSAQIGPIITRDTTGPNATTVNGAERLLGNLISLASAAGAGSTLVTLGRDLFGFWGLFQALQVLTRVSVVANPFLVTTHKYKAEVKVGEIQRVQTAIVQGQTATQATGDLEASLRVVVTPQISYDDMVTLTTYVELSQFTGTSTSVGPTRLVRKVSTEALLANREVLALGGLIQDTVSETETKVPILGDIPLLGWLFKNKNKVVDKTSLLILISPEIIKPYEPTVAQRFTYAKINDAKQTLFEMQPSTYTRDPIHRWFFNDHRPKEMPTIDKFVSIQQRYLDESQREAAAHMVALKDPKESPLVKKDSLLDFIEPQESKEGVKA